MNYKIINAVSPEGVEFQYLLVDGTWQVPMTEENPMYWAYLNPEAGQVNYLTAPAIMESTQPDEADLTEGNN
jgi:hypothetical protein